MRREGGKRMCQSMRNSNWQPIELIYFQFLYSLSLSFCFLFLPASTGASCANLVNWISTEHINELITIIVATILNRAKVVCPLKLVSRCGSHDHDRATHVSAAHSPILSGLRPSHSHARLLSEDRLIIDATCHWLWLWLWLPLLLLLLHGRSEIFRPWIRHFGGRCRITMKYEVKSSNKFRAFKQQ